MPARQSKPKKRVVRTRLYADLDTEDAHIRESAARATAEAPARGEQLGMDEDYADNPTPFAALPLSKRTTQGLADAGFEHMTPIQAAAIPHALAQRDVLGAAKTGSGKTLAFLVPLLELLWRDKWSAIDGLGALVISPTRELAMQIFDVLRQIGKHHTFSAGLITGGKKEFREEQAHVCSMSLLVATPGRLVQHLEQTAGFDVSSCKLLVLDEADRILDLGFSAQLAAVLDHLPPRGRQTMLFSATQTRSVKDLARLSLNKPEYVAVNDKAAHVTPARLAQHYCVCSLASKLDILFSFIKAHLKSKAIVFLATCSQVRFVYECFRGLQPGVPLMCLHGKHKQARRTATYLDFIRKPAAFLLATDIAARGLDFPAVDWVVQMDCPEDAAMYIHRVGRTARYTATGRALLFLLPSEEEAMLAALAKARVPKLGRLAMNPHKKISVTQRAANIVAANPGIKQLATKAFSSYVRSVHLMPDKNVFGSAAALPQNEFAVSLGLATKPTLDFLGSDSEGEEEEDGEEQGGEGPAAARRRDKAERAREDNRQKKNKNKKLQRLKEQIKEEKLRRKRAREGEGPSSGSGGPSSGGGGDGAAGSAPHDDELLVLKGRMDPDLSDGEDPDPRQAEDSGSRKPAKLRIDETGVSRRAAATSKRIKFDDLGAAVDASATFSFNNLKTRPATDGDPTDLVRKNEEFLSKVRERMAATADQDKADARARIKDKHSKKRQKLKNARDDRPGEAPTLLSVGASGSEDEASEDDMEVDGGASEAEDHGEDAIRANEDEVLRLLRGS